MGCEANHPGRNSEVWLTLIHMNDVYEMMPVSGGTLGGVARVATLKKQLKAKNPNTYLTMGGDLHGPSGLGLAVVNGEQLAGKQNVAVMNKVGIDYFTFGDHEFDIYPGDAHAKRLAETEFQMVSGNVFGPGGNPLPGVIVNDIITITNDEGDSAKVGLFAVTEPIPRTQIEITYLEHEEVVAQQVAALAGEVDILIAMTHLSIVLDRAIAQRHPEIDLILGGDDHEHMKVEADDGLAPIIKADSNARSVQIIDLYYDTATATLRLEDRLQPITDAIVDDPIVKAEVDKWTHLAFDGFRATGVEPTEVVTIPTIDLDGFANTIRNGHTALTRLMVRGIHATANKPMFSFMFSALIRMDDLIPAGGHFTMYDVIRSLPNNFDIVTIDIPGNALKFVLDFGEQSKGSGQYILYTEHITRDGDGNWFIDGEQLDEARLYQAGTTAEAAKDFATLGVTLVETHALNLQQLMIQELTAEFGHANC